MMPWLPPLRRLLAGTCLAASLAGCGSAYWQSPSILTTAPPPAASTKGVSRDSRGGFSVLVEAPRQPTATRALADIGAYAQSRGFVAVGPIEGGTRYASGKIVLDAFFREKDLHVVALLHSVGLSERYAADFYRGFNREYAPKYGEENPVIANDFEPYVRPPI